jgi:hypothetical protein
MAVGTLLLAFLCAATGVAVGVFRLNEAVLDQLANVVSRDRIGDLALFVGVEPDASLSDVQNVRSQSLLCAQISPSETSTST